MHVDLQYITDIVKIIAVVFGPPFCHDSPNRRAQSKKKYARFCVNIGSGTQSKTNFRLSYGTRTKKHEVVG